VRKDLLAGSGKPLDGEFFQAFADPVQARRGPGVFKRKNEEDAAWGKRGRAAGNGRGALPGGRICRQKK